jgi:hypothetical protein
MPRNNCMRYTAANKPSSHVQGITFNIEFQRWKVSHKPQGEKCKHLGYYIDLETAKTVRSDYVTAWLDRNNPNNNQEIKL